MILQFCNLCQKVTSAITLTQRFATKAKKQYVSPRRKAIQRKLEKLRLQEKLKANEGRIPIISTKRKEYNFYVDDKFNKFQPILITQGWFHSKSKWDYFTIHPPENKFIEEKDVSFKDFDFHPKFIENLENNGLTTPTQIQTEAFPKLMNKLNTIVAAETGSGKSLAYLLPLVNQIYEEKNEQAQRGLNSPLGLIITPSRELAAQLRREVQKLVKGTNIRTKLIIGGKVKRMMRNPPVSQVDILIATIGALSKFVSNKVYSIKHLQHVVLDEADSLFHFTFHEKVIPLLRKINFCDYTINSETQEPKMNGAQLTMVSATMPSNISDVLHDIINCETLVTATTCQLHHINVPQKFIRIGSSQKPMFLVKLVKEKVMKKQPVIVFVNKAETCMWISHVLKQFNVNNICLHGSMPENTRRKKYIQFNNRQVHVLCATDAGSRGLDTIDVIEVINYDFPLQTAEYIHRCGRTGRVGSPKNCKVTNFITRPLEIILARKIEIAIKKGLPIPIVDMFDRASVAEYDSLIQQMEGTEEPEEFKNDEFNYEFDENENDHEEHDEKNKIPV